MMNNIKSIFRDMSYAQKILFGFVIASFSACTEPMDRSEFDIESAEAVLVVDGIITDEAKAHFVKLTTTTSLFDDNDVPLVSGAIVTLDDGFEAIQLQEKVEKPGYYYTPDDYQGVVGRTYSLNVSNIDMDRDGKKDEYTAGSTLNDVPPIDKLDLEYNEFYKTWTIKLYAQEPGQTEDFYAFSFKVNGTDEFDNYGDFGYTDDAIVNGMNLDGFPIFQIAEEDESGYIPIVTLKDDDWVTLEMYGITEHFFEYLVAVDMETSPKMPMFSGPPANPETNLSNGAFGYFAAFSVVRDSIQVDYETMSVPY